MAEADSPVAMAEPDSPNSRGSQSTMVTMLSAKLQLNLPPAPEIDGPLAELSFGKLTASIEWLFSAVQALEVGVSNTNNHLVKAAKQSEITERKLLELCEAQNLPPPTPVPASPPPEPEPVEEEPPPPPTPPPTPPVVVERELIIEETPPPRVKTPEPLQSPKSPGGSSLRYARPQDVAKCTEAIAALDKAHQLTAETVHAMKGGLDSVAGELRAMVSLEVFEERLAALEQRLQEERAREREEDTSEVKRILGMLQVAETNIAELVAKNKADGDVAGGLREANLRVSAVEGRIEEGEEAQRERDKAERLRRENGEAPQTVEDLSAIDLAEEVRKLRSRLESMEHSMTEEQRRLKGWFDQHEQNTIQPVEKGGIDLSNLDVDAIKQQIKILAEQSQQIMSETEENLQRCEEVCMKEQQNIFRIVKAQERLIERMDGKVDDVTKKLPRVIELLEPLQQAVDRQNESKGISRGDLALDADGRSQNEATAMAGFVRECLNSTMIGIRDDLSEDVARLKADLEAALHSKAGMNELAALRRSLDAWTQHAPGCSMSKDSGSAQSPDSWRAPRPKPLPEGLTPPSGSGHAKCKVPTCPMTMKASKSISHLPALSSERHLPSPKVAHVFVA